MELTSAQQMSRLLLAAFLRSVRKEPSLSMPEEYKRLFNELDAATYACCLAWASEQQQLAMEVKGDYYPFTSELEG